VERIAKAGLLMPGDAAELGPALALAQRSLSGTEKRPSRRLIVLNGVLADYRAGALARAADPRDLPGLDPENRLDLQGLIVQAMARHQLGRKAESQHALALARESLGRFLSRLDRGQFYDGDWHDWLHCQVLLREADALIEGPR
jgi:hypothetical protein